MANHFLGETEEWQNIKQRDSVFFTTEISINCITISKNIIVIILVKIILFQRSRPGWWHQSQRRKMSVKSK